MGWPQYLYLALTFIGLGMVCAKHDQPKEGRYNGWLSFIAAGLICALLWWGGFFG